MFIFNERCQDFELHSVCIYTDHNYISCVFESYSISFVVGLKHTCNGRSIWHGLPDIRNIRANNGRQSAILNLIDLKIFRVYPS